ncbi:hypothetical protein PG994_008566 [Apiospora phragmitis]|uniref:Uncharacterized protein n=1 Tax=Apiospora phragmitis TaxID=2905665 RepID=A0ABR1UGV7_9PEZI
MNNFHPYRGSPLNSVQPEDRIILQPFLFREGEGESLAAHLAPLKAATATWRATAATSAEAHQVVLCLLPDVLTFQALPAEWGDKDRPDDRGGGTGFPSYSLRFNGSEDVILFHADWTDL